METTFFKRTQYESDLREAQKDRIATIERKGRCDLLPDHPELFWNHTDSEEKDDCGRYVTTETAAKVCNGYYVFAWKKQDKWVLKLHTSDWDFIRDLFDGGYCPSLRVAKEFAQQWVNGWYKSGQKIKEYNHR